ncbi:MAG: RNA polymerase-binding protein DksA [Thioalkalivibrionaceae bacterium]
MTDGQSPDFGAIDDRYRPQADEPYMNPRQLEYFRLKLLDWREALVRDSETTVEQLKQGEWREPDPNDRASHESDSTVELRTRERYRKLISKIDQALVRIERGEYGYCEDTGEPIGVGRLEARPIATLSIAAQERHERNERMRGD